MRSFDSHRLNFQRLSAEQLDAFHGLIVDEHIYRYLLDGECMDRRWCKSQVEASDRMFAERNVGLWLAALRTSPAEPIGFCGFICFAETGPEPQLLYALRARFGGQGLASEMAESLVAYVRKHTSATEVLSAVDEPNVASSRVLLKTGFVPTHTSPGAFGRILHYRLVLSNSELGH